jgi:hypothetical protein
MKKIVLAFFFISSAFAQDIDQLSKDITWRRLLHYNKTLLGVESEADDDRFFLAKDGKNHPAHELESTIAAFKANNKEAICRFPARYTWLKKVIGLPAFDFKSCEAFAEFSGKLGAKSASLIFSSYYINTPASAFGHTFLRLNRHAHGAKQEDKTELLDYGINYAALMDTKNALVYAVKAIFGMFPGVFTSVPYYYKVREYNDHESRDLWEYELNLSQEQIDMIVAHVWEMSQTNFFYYYFTENCSYQILAIIDVVDPKFKLVDRIPFYVIPADTVRAAVEEPGLVSGKSFRPSALTRLERGTKEMTPEERLLVQNLANDPKKYEAELKKLPSEKDQAKILDSSIEAMDFLYAKDLLLEKGQKKNDKHELLMIRAENPEISEAKVYHVEPQMFPDQAHRSQRVGLSSGYSAGEGQYQQLSMRFALHDQLDPLAGQPPFSEITFADVALRFQQQDYSSSRKLLINHLDIFRVKSYQPVTPWQQNFSWNARIGMGTLRDEVMTDKLSSTIELGGGGTVGFGNNQTSIITLLTKLELNQQDHFEHGWRVGLGPELSARFILSDKLSLGLVSSYKWRHYFTDNDFSSTSFQRGGEFRWHLNSTWSLFMKTDWYDIKSQTNQWSELGFYAYF